MTGRGIGGPHGEHDAFSGKTARGNITVTTPDEARKAVQRKKEHGCDAIKLNEFISHDLAKVVVRRSAPARPAGHLPQPRCNRIRQGRRRRHRAHLGGRLQHHPLCPGTPEAGRGPAGGTDRSGDRRRLLPDRELRCRDRGHGEAQRRLDADHRQMAATAVAERRTLPGTGERHPRQSEGRPSAGGARGDRLSPTTSCSSATRRSSSISPGSATRRPTSSSAASSRPAAS